MPARKDRAPVKAMPPPKGPEQRCPPAARNDAACVIHAPCGNVVHGAERDAVAHEAIGDEPQLALALGEQLGRDVLLQWRLSGRLYGLNILQRIHVMPLST